MEIKTPLIIKEALGEEVYNLFEEYRIKYHNPNRTIKLYMSEESYNYWMDALKEDYKNQLENGKTKS